MIKQIFKINGFHCEACMRLSTMRIKKISEVYEVNISQDGVVDLCSSRIITLDDMSKALDGLGYTVVAV